MPRVDMRFTCQLCGAPIRVVYAGLPCNFNDLVNGNWAKDIARVNEECDGCKFFRRKGHWHPGFGPVPAVVQALIDESARAKP